MNDIYQPYFIPEEILKLQFEQPNQYYKCPHCGKRCKLIDMIQYSENYHVCEKCDEKLS